MRRPNTLPLTNLGRLGRLAFFGLLFSVALLISGCGLFTADSADACTDGGMLLIDDFNGERNCGWVEYNRAGTVVELIDGTLQLSSSQPGQFWWTNPGRDFNDVVINTQTRQVNGPDDNAFGVICRYQSVENFYIFLISGDGYYAIGKYQSGSDQIQYLTPNGQYVYSDVINQGSAINEIRASCVGNELRLTVNGIFLGSVVDDSFARGDVGVGVTTFQPGTAVVQFDNFRVAAP